MNTKDNQRTRLSKILLKNAMMDLLKEKGSVTKITVKELCEKAELNRSTFYSHYEEPKDLLNEVENDLISLTQEHIKNIRAENDIRALKYILSFLQFIRNNDKQFRTLLVDSTDTGFKTKFMNQSILLFVENLNIEIPKDIEQYVYSYVMNGSYGIIIQWIRSDYSVEDIKIVDLLFRLNEHSLRAIM